MKESIKSRRRRDPLGPSAASRMKESIKMATSPCKSGYKELTTPPVETAGVTESIQKAAPGSGDKELTPPPVERAGVTEPTQQAAAGSGDNELTPPPVETAGVTEPIQQAASSARVKRLRATLVLAAALVVTLAVPMGVYGQPMSQVWILSLNICSYVFAFLLYTRRSRWFYTEFVRLSYAPLLAWASQMGSVTATFILFIGMVWAAGNFGYYLALHHLRERTERLAIEGFPDPSCPTKHTIEDLNFILHAVVPVVVLLWALVMMLLVNVLRFTDEMFILMFLSYFGWVFAGICVIIVTMMTMRGVLVGDLMIWFLAALVPWMIVSPMICIASKILAILCHSLLMVALVAYLLYNLAIYEYLLETATPSTTTPGNEDTLCSEIPGGKTVQRKSDPVLG